MINRTFLRRALVPGLLISALWPSLASASGFALIENNARGQGNAYAGVAAYTPDASTVYFNPAGLTDIEGDQLSVAAHYIIPHAKFSDDGSTASDLFAGSPFADMNGTDDDGGSPAFVPNLYWAKTLSDSTKFGLGINSPFGLATKYNDDWVGRYHAVVSDLQTLNINPSIGYKINDSFSIGGGLNFMLGTVDLTSAIDFGAVCMAQFNYTTCQGLGALPQQADGFADLTGDNYGDVSTGYNLGLKFKFNENSALGLSYRSEVEMNISGEADFKVPTSASFVYAADLFLDSDLEATVDLPASASLSYALQVDAVTYLFDVTWTGWSSFEELRIVYDNAAQPDTVTTEEWVDTMRYSFGMDYQYTEDLVYRFGVAYDETPVPSAERRTPRLPGNDRTWLSLGLSKQMGDGMSIDIGFSHLFIDDSKIDNEYESSVPTLASNLKGTYESSINIYSVQLNWQY
jgi:long-chain fatty acid transport protein